MDYLVLLYHIRNKKEKDINMKPTLKNLHYECSTCENIQVFSLHMSGDHDYCCKKTPNPITKDKHNKPCNRYTKRINQEEI